MGSQFNTSSVGYSGVLYEVGTSDGIIDAVYFDFPALWNIPDNVADGNDTIIMEVVALLLNAATNTYNVNEYVVSTLTYNAKNYNEQVRIYTKVPNLYVQKVCLLFSFPSFSPYFSLG